MHATDFDLISARFDHPRLEREVWRGRAALARHCAAELREQMRVSVWMARRQISYRRSLMDEARRHLAEPRPPAEAPRLPAAALPAG